MHEICSVLMLVIRSKINLCQYFTLLSKKINKSASWQIACLTCGLSVGVFKRLTNIQNTVPPWKTNSFGDRKGCPARQDAVSLPSASAETLQVLTQLFSPVPSFFPLFRSVKEMLHSPSHTQRGTDTPRTSLESSADC